MKDAQAAPQPAKIIKSYSVAATKNRVARCFHLSICNVQDAIKARLNALIEECKDRQIANPVAVRYDGRIACETAFRLLDEVLVMRPNAQTGRNSGDYDEDWFHLQASLSPKRDQFHDFV